MDGSAVAHQPVWELKKYSRRILEVLRQPESRERSIAAICKVAGLDPSMFAHAALDPAFVEAAKEFGVVIEAGRIVERNGVQVIPHGRAADRLWAVVQDPANHDKSIQALCHLAGYKSKDAWYTALKDPKFVHRVTELGFPLDDKRRSALYGWAGEDDSEDRATRVLRILAQPENRMKSIRQICALAGYSKAIWTELVKDPDFVTTAGRFGVVIIDGKIVERNGFEPYNVNSKHKILQALSGLQSRNLPGSEIARLAGVTKSTYTKCLKDNRFREVLHELGVSLEQISSSTHTEVSLSVAPGDELEKDRWDMRRLKADYPKHRPASQYQVDFTWIGSPQLKAQVKQYFRLKLTSWKASTFRGNLNQLRWTLEHLPQDVHLGNISREHILEILPMIAQYNDQKANRGLIILKSLILFAATSRAWIGPRPPRFLIWPEDIPARPYTLPRPLPLDVVERMDGLLAEAVRAMDSGKQPPLMGAMYWNALLILRYSGMRFEDLAHLRCPDERGHNGCLEQDAKGDWWIRITYHNTKMNRDHRIPTATAVVEAIRRQAEVARTTPDVYQENYLFRTPNGILLYDAFNGELKRKLSPHLIHEGLPYRPTAHQFRHTIATEMIANGCDIYTLKEFLGHTSLSMTEKYVAVYRETLRDRYEAYWLSKRETPTVQTVTDQLEIVDSSVDTDGGWVGGKEGRLYRSSLPGMGYCSHLPMHDPCPTPPVCWTCSKFQTDKKHLSHLEFRVQNLRLTVDALNTNPAFARAKQRHEDELHQAEKIVQTVREAGFWDGRRHNN